MAEQRRKLSPIDEAELARLAQVTPEDVHDAQRAWRKDASPAFKDLLDARPSDAPPEPEE